MTKDLQKVIQFATIAHNGQVRKGSNIPYISHIFEVGVILAENGADQDILFAGILHDCVEDTFVTLTDIENQFGKSVSNIVAQESENKELSWEERKLQTIRHLKTMPTNIKMVACADKLSNMRSIVNDYAVLKEELWTRFKRGYEPQKWYYTNLVQSLADLKDYKMYQEFKQLVTEFFNH